MPRHAKILVLTIALLCPFAATVAAPIGPKTAPRHVRDIPAPDARVNLNHASLDELMKVPGMTRTWAGRIIRFRPYHAKSDLLNRGVVTSQVYSRIKDYVIAHRDKP